MCEREREREGGREGGREGEREGGREREWRGMGEGRDRDHPTKLLCSGKLQNFLPMLQVPVEEEAEALEKFKAISAAHEARRQKHYTGTC